MSSQTDIQTARPAAVLQHLGAFDGPPEAYVQEMLAAQCAAGPAAGAVLIVPRLEGPAEIVAAFPAVENKEEAPKWIGYAVKGLEHAEGEEAVVLGLGEGDSMYGGASKEHVVLVPVRRDGELEQAAAFHLPTQDTALIERARERLELTAGLLSVYQLRQTLRSQQVKLNLITHSEEVLNAVNGQRKFKSAAYALCDELARRYDGERVSVGFAAGRYIKLQAMSHTEHFTRKMKLVQDIESTMEECYDQDIEVQHPCPPDAPVIARQAKRLSEEHGPTSVFSLPLRLGGDEPEPVGVVTIERPADQPLSPREAEALRITCDLVSSRLHELYERDLLFVIRWARKWRKGLAWLIGPRQTWIKATAIGVAAALAIVTLVPGTQKVSAPFEVQPSQRQIITAPFQGELGEVFVEVNDEIVAGETVLAMLETYERQAQLADLYAQLETKRGELDTALREGDRSGQRIAQAEIQRTQAQITNLEHEIEQARIVSPMSGVVIDGDLRRRIGGMVDMGETLLEIAPQGALRVELRVPESRIADLEVGMEGELATSAEPGRHMRFRVERIEPVAEVMDGQNVFRVRAVLLDESSHLLAGQEGVAKVDIEERPLIVIWTRDLVNWVRMKLWI